MSQPSFDTAAEAFNTLTPLIQRSEHVEVINNTSTKPGAAFAILKRFFAEKPDLENAGRIIDFSDGVNDAKNGIPVQGTESPVRLAGRLYQDVLDGKFVRVEDLTKLQDQLAVSQAFANRIQFAMDSIQATLATDDAPEVKLARIANAFTPAAPPPPEQPSADNIDAIGGPVEPPPAPEEPVTPPVPLTEEGSPVTP